MGVLLAGLSALLYGSADFAGGYAARKTPAMSVVVISQLFGIIAALVALPFIAPAQVTPRDLVWGGVAGLGGAIGLIALYRGIADGVVAIVSPTAALLGAAIPVVFGVAIGERPSLLTWLGVLLCLPAVVTLSLGGDSARDLRRIARSLAFGAIAGLGFGAFYIAISRPSPDAGLWPLVAARAVSVVAILLAALAAGRRPFMSGGQLPIIVIAGICDMSANVAFVLSTHFSLLVVATVVGSLYPAPTVLLGRFVFGQRIGWLRIIGFTLALAGVALIGIGSLP